MQINQALKKLRKKRGFSQRELAEKVDCAPTYISTIEVGKLEPSATLIRKIANALGVTEATIYLLAMEQSDFTKKILSDSVSIVQCIQEEVLRWDE